MKTAKLFKIAIDNLRRNALLLFFYYHYVKLSCL